MTFCPNCGASVVATELECPKCGAIFGGIGGWQPVETPTPKEGGFPLIYNLGRVLVWGGHFFLIAVPLLFVFFHLFFYRGGGTSGVPLAYSMMFSFVLYIPGHLLVALGEKPDSLVNPDAKKKLRK